PKVGLMPTSACAPAGFWIEPPVSSAMPAATKLAAVAVAEPLLLAPGASVKPYALYVGPSKLVLARVPSAANAGRFDLPRMIAPAASRRAVTGASSAGIKSTPPALEANPT